MSDEIKKRLSKKLENINSGLVLLKTLKRQNREFVRDADPNDYDALESLREDMERMINLEEELMNDAQDILDSLRAYEVMEYYKTV